MKILAITPIVWKTIQPCAGEFPCWTCRFKEATKFIEFSNGDLSTKLPVCDKCAEYAAAYPTWLDEMLLTRRMEAVETHLKQDADHAASVI